MAKSQQESVFTETLVLLHNVFLLCFWYSCRPDVAKQYITADNSNLTALLSLEEEPMSSLPVARRGTIVAGTTSFLKEDDFIFLQANDETMVTPSSITFGFGS